MDLHLYSVHTWLAFSFRFFIKFQEQIYKLKKRMQHERQQKYVAWLSVPVKHEKYRKSFYHEI